MNLDLGFGLRLHYYHGIKETRRSGQAYFKCQKDNSARYTLKLEVKLKIQKDFGGICFIRYTDSDLRRELLEISDNSVN